MTKHCSVCATENRDEAQFCRSCGTALPVTSGTLADEADALAAGIVCGGCGFQNKPGVSYCANCGVALLAAAARPGPAPTPADDPFSGLSASPPPLSYPSFAAVPPYPAAPAEVDLQEWAGAPSPDTDVGELTGDPYAADTSGRAAYDAAAMPPDLPDADRVAASREQQVFGAVNAPAGASPGRGRLVVGAVIAALVVAAGAGWWFMMGSSPATTPATATAPVLPPPAALPASTPAAIAVAPPVLASSMPLSTVAPGEVVVAPGGPASAATTAAVEPAVAPPAVSPAASPVVSVIEADAEARRQVAERLRKEKTAREKTEREAKAKALAEQRDRDAAAAAAAARRDQDALRRRAEEATRARGVPAATPVPAAQAPQPRGVREICAGRGTIAEAICQSRECGASEHAHEVVCRQIREQDERRRYYTN